jgi:hypothetical protein
MNADAVVMMVIAMLVLWGGLVLALLNLKRAPDSSADGSHDDL